MSTSRPAVDEFLGQPLKQIFTAYQALTATAPLQGEAGLGGKLLFAGGLSGPSRELLYAANIAGAASLAASANAEEQRSAIRDGVVDFVVTSLSEALRILKNEIRKGQAVSVGVASDPRLVVAEMLDRGVLPDLLPLVAGDVSGLGDADRCRFEAHGALTMGAAPPDEGKFVTWTVNVHHARSLPRLDLCAHSVLPESDLMRHRWIRSSPRYLGKMAQRGRGVAMTDLELERFRDKAAEVMRDSLRGSADGVPLMVQIRSVGAES